MRDELIFIASGVIVMTLLLANFALPLLAPNHAENTSSEMREVTIEVLRRTVEELTTRITPENRRAVLMVIDSYTKRISRLKQLAGIVDLRGYEQLKLRALYWEKEFVRNRQAEVKAHPNPNKAVQELNLEACERMLDQIMNSLRHASADPESGHTVSQIRGRIRRFQHQTGNILKRASNRIRRTTPLVSEDQIFAHMQVPDRGDRSRHQAAQRGNGQRHVRYGILFRADPRLPSRRSVAEVAPEYGGQYRGGQSGGRYQTRQLRHRTRYRARHA